MTKVTMLESKELQSELDEIMSWFQSEDQDIDEAIAKYERALAIIELLKSHLKEAKNTVTKLNKKFGVK